MPGAAVPPSPLALTHRDLHAIVGQNQRGVDTRELAVSHCAKGGGGVCGAGLS